VTFWVLAPLPFLREKQAAMEKAIVTHFDEIEPQQCPCGTTHRAIGKMKIVNIPIPAFDPHDEWFN
jgi:hypothetical protein